MSEKQAPDLGDLVIVLLASTLAGLRDRLESDVFKDESELVADLTHTCDSCLGADNRYDIEYGSLSGPSPS
jgi:hypothetical protein